MNGLSLKGFLIFALGSFRNFHAHRPAHASQGITNVFYRATSRLLSGVSQFGGKTVKQPRYKGTKKTCLTLCLCYLVVQNNFPAFLGFQAHPFLSAVSILLVGAYVRRL
jgi:hypothetical protein